MKTFLAKLLASVGDLLSSKKAIAAIATFVSQYVVADPDVRHGMLASGLAYVLGQALADHGKSAALIEAAAAQAAPVTTTVALGPTTTLTTTAAPALQPGITPTP